MNARPLVAVVGNPNTGKTTLFNQLTGARAQVGNYPGVTVERAVGRLRTAHGEIDVVDVPGAYSLAASSPDERIAIDALLGRHGNPRPDLVLLVLDAANLERNLYLTLQLVELRLPLLIALNMADAVEGSGGHLDAEALSAALRVPVVPTVATRRHSLDALRAAIDEALATPPIPAGFVWQPTPALMADLDALLPVLGDEVAPDAPIDQARAVALWALMSIDAADELVDVPAALRTRVLARLHQAHQANRDPDGEVVAARYAWIDQHAPTFIQRSPTPRRASDRVDAVLLHPVAGFAVFLLIMFTLFQALFAWSEPLIDLVDLAVGSTGDAVKAALPEGVLADFLADGVIAGVGSVLVFLPQILLLFAFIGLLEDSGYLARAAFLMDRVMNRIGLHGRAFVPMLSAYACAVPAIMATRTMERRRDRYLTMMVLPLTTCSARLPVYTLLIGALVPPTLVLGVLRTQSLVMVGMYLFGILTALITAAVLGRTVLKGERVPLLLELPPYRRPDPRSVGRLVISRGKVFLREAGTVILACTVALWALLYFPRTPAAGPAPDGPHAAEVQPGPAADPADAEHAGLQLRNSYGGRLGRAIEPLIEPLGFDWKIGVGLIGAFAAREVFVSTLGVVFSLGQDVDETSISLRAQLRDERAPDGSPRYTPLMALSLLIFFALACQCMSTLAAVKRETRSYRWPIFLFTYMTALAWLVSFVVYQGGRALGFA